MDLRARSCLVAALLVLATGAVLAGCSPSGTAASPLREAMLAGFCPEAGRLRVALAAFPPPTARPTPAEWRDLRLPAIAMMDAAAALPKSVADLPGYADKVASARTAGRALVEAVDRRDAVGTEAAGTKLLLACAGCHAAGGVAPELTPAIAQAPATP